MWECEWHVFFDRRSENFKVTATGIRDVELTRGDSPEILSDQVSFLRTNPFLSTFETRRECGCASLQPHHSFTLETIDVFTFTMNLNDRRMNTIFFFFFFCDELCITQPVYLIRTSVRIEVTGNVALRIAMTDLSSMDNSIKLIWWFTRQRRFTLSAETHHKGVVIVSGWEWRCAACFVDLGDAWRCEFHPDLSHLTR